MPRFFIESPEDSRLEAYRDLKQPRARAAKLFVAEGEKLVSRLLESPCTTESILCSPAALDRLQHRIPPETAIYIAPTALISRLIGFRFHRGVLACGVRPAAPSIESLWQAHPLAEP